MGKIIETDDGTPVFVGESGECEKDIAQHAENQGVDPCKVGEAAIMSIFTN